MSTKLRLEKKFLERRVSFLPRESEIGKPLDTCVHVPVMVKTRFATSESSCSTVVAARASAADANGGINLRIESRMMRGVSVMSKYAWH